MRYKAAQQSVTSVLVCLTSSIRSCTKNSMVPFHTVNYTRVHALESPRTRAGYQDPTGRSRPVVCRHACLHTTGPPFVHDDKSFRSASS